MPKQNQPARCGAPGVVVREAKNGKTKIIRTEGKRWSQGSERKFLEELCATCNVTAAAEAAQFSTTAVYNRRKKNPGFAAEWQAAVEQGYARLEAMLIENATDSLRTAPITGAEQPVSARGKDVSFADALNLLRLHRAEARGGAAQNFRAREKAPDREAVRASILLRIEAIERMDARKDALLARRGEGAEAID
ncbi:MAG: hypothetical protein P0Y56_03705 [Candidatus Andeanibacterium colombiense]|uniref:Terminase small subunit n=1 Tax=Candidatus Andeanibacterium colombiense TaxID=3121345 RepID=A0AAJ5X887_9SPHN|nr:MAG: hypothetical protein P0Y56_03705 [Sphingomonadaceae bacterium]